MGKSTDELARAAFEAYADHAEGKTHDDRTIPAWDDLGEDVQNHWIHATETLLTEVYSSPVDHGNPPARRAPRLGNTAEVTYLREG